MKKESKTINWRVLIGYILMILTFLLYGLSFLTNEGIILFVPVPILWISWLIYSVHLLTKPEFKFHGKILFGIWILIILFIIGFSYIFLIFSSPPSTISKTISILDSECKDGKITIILRNDGTADIRNSELQIWINDIEKTTQFNFSFDTISSGGTTVATSLDTYEMNKIYQIRVISPSNSVRFTASCFK